MKIFLVLVGLLVALAQADENSWNNFQVKYNKAYKDQTEHYLRQKIFNDNLQKIEEHNKKYEQGLSSYTLGVNQFTDLTSEEFAATLKTLPMDKTLKRTEKRDLTKNGTIAIPDSIDWRNQGVVTEVKNQAQCGSCWAFSATGTIESQHAIQTGNLISLSEQLLVDCNTDSNGGCSGGVVQYAIDYVSSNGLCLEQDYPYTAVQGSCESGKNIVIKTSSYVDINRDSESSLKEAVALVGPISVAMNGLPIQSYNGGIFDSDCENVINHAVLAVGYGTDSATGVDYWIMKNSWSGGWGEQGYFRLKMGSNLCAIATQACYPIM